MDPISGAMGSLLPKLLQLLQEQYYLQTGVKRKIRSLHHELYAMQVALYQAAVIEPDQRDKALEDWASHVRDLSYDAEDIIDALPLRLEGPSRGGQGGRIGRVAASFSGWKSRREIADKIDDISEMTLAVAASFRRYNIDYHVFANPAAISIDPRLLALYKAPKEIVGIEVSRNEVISKLGLDADDELKIVSIVGIGGLGKTTLAKAVYDRIQGAFVCSAFVSVSRNPDMKKVLKDILFEIDKQICDRELWDERQLIHEVRSQLANKRYLIVIDDVWDVRSWELIKIALTDSKCGSRVITTTRIFHVAENAGDIYSLNTLSFWDSEALFNETISRVKKDPVGIDVPEVFESLLQKCGGVPLAIITMASLFGETQKDDWSKVYDRIGFGSEVGGNADVENTRKILKFSYYNLPYHLRACLLHLHIYPEDYVIKKETLIWKWAAEGFLPEKQQTGLFEVGETYFNELINRNMIMPVEEESHGGIIIGCRVHNLFLDIICSESTSANFVVVQDGSKQNPISVSKARRLAVQKRAAEQGNFLANTCQEKVRSFNATMCQFTSTVSLSSFKVLRVLAIEECTFKEVSPYHLKHIGALVHLRYLGLYNTPIEKLPDEIGDLFFLQTLDLRGTKVKSLPRGVGRLTQLKCLRTDETITVPDWIGKLTSLEELRLDDVSKSENFVEELGKLTELRELEIWIEEFDDYSNKALVESMHNLRKIQVLGLMSSMPGEEANWQGYVPPPQLRELRLTIAFSRLPAWISRCFVPTLSHLCVDVKVVEEQDLDILGALPELISLELIMPLNVFPSIKASGAFPKLRCFDTSAPFRFLPEAMPRLESLRFKVSVQALKRAGFDFDFATLSILPCLQKVEVEISCRGARANNSLEAESAVRRAVDEHPNSPILTTKRTDK